MLESSTPLLLNSRVVFVDGNSAQLTAIEVDESWEVLNIVVSRGLFRWRQRVRLPFSTASAWSESNVHLTCTQSEAFSREIPPVATPSRPISTETPMALAGSRISGALVSTRTRTATFLIVRLGTRQVRVAISDTTFEGKTLRINVQPEALDEHRTDGDIAADAWRLLRDDHVIMPDELDGMEVSSLGSVLSLTGNVRRNSTKERTEALMSSVAGITAFRSSLKDDLQLEIDIAALLTKAGIQRVASIYPRSSLGEVTLFGRAPTDQVAEDATKIASRADGVLNVTTRMEIGSESSARSQPATAS